MVNKHTYTHVHTDLAKPTPRLTPCASLRMRVEMTCPKGLRRFSSSCSSMETGRLDRYRLVGSCSCCCNTNIRVARLQKPLKSYNASYKALKCHLWCYGVRRALNSTKMPCYDPCCCDRITVSQFFNKERCQSDCGPFLCTKTILLPKVGDSSPTSNLCV